LAEAGHDVTLIEEGSHLPLNSAPHFSPEEIAQKYRCGGITVGLGRTKVAYVEGRCVGGGSEINRGLYHRTPPEVLEEWSARHRVDSLQEADMAAHFLACEQRAQVSFLPGSPPPLSGKLHDGAQLLGWESLEVPRLVRYGENGNGDPSGKKESMTETFVPRYTDAGGKLMPDTCVRRLSRVGRRWRLESEHTADGNLEISADQVFVSCGAIQTPALLRRSGITRNVGNGLRMHPMVKVVARFPEVVNGPALPDPVHQVKHFDPRFSMGCSVSSRPALALAMVDHPEHLRDAIRDWQYMALYYAQTTGGRGTIRTLPGFRDPLVRLRFREEELRDLAESVRRLCECLFAAGAIELYPSIVHCPVLKSEADLEQLPAIMPSSRANLSTLHVFSSCRMGQDRSRCAADSFGRVYNADSLYIADASLLCGPTVVNPQGSVMAVAHRNVLEFLSRSGK
jgi:choline dehydrogenase-like flavoprotein